MPSQRLLLCQRAGSRKEQGRKNGQETGTHCISALFGPRGAPTSQEHCFLRLSKSSRGKIHLTPTAAKLTLYFSSDSTPGTLPPACWLGHSEEPVPKVTNLCNGWSSSADRSIALGCLQAQADITFSTYSSHFLGLGTTFLFFLMEAGICFLLVKTKTWRAIYVHLILVASNISAALILA